MAGGSSLPAVDLDTCKGEGGRLADGYVFQLADGDPALFGTLSQGRLDQVSYRGKADEGRDQASNHRGRSFDEFPPADRLRHMHLQNAIWFGVAAPSTILLAAAHAQVLAMKCHLD